jgi:hypothetical protein
MIPGLFVLSVQTDTQYRIIKYGRYLTGGNMEEKKRKVLKRILTALGILLILAGAFFIYTGIYYHADNGFIDSYQTEVKLRETELPSGDIVFDPLDAKIGFIFYPGGKVEHTAYIPLMREIASKGYLCILCRMPFRLAIMDIHRADNYIGGYEGIKTWYIGGHSLGGVSAAFEAADREGKVKGLVLLGAYSSKDISKGDIRVLSIYGSEDKVLKMDKYEKNRDKLPSSMTETIIEGGCHAYFGAYGAQKGDGVPSITNEEQIRLSGKIITDWIAE